MAVDALTLPAPSGRHPGAVVAGQTVRRIARPALVWGVVFGFYVAESALGFATAYKTTAARAAFAKEFGSNVGVNALIGPGHHLATVAGFTAWRSLGVLSILGAVWGLLAGTRLLRGEEEAGRWELLVTGQTTRRRAAAQALVGLGVGAAILWVVTAVITIGVGRSPKAGFGVSAAMFFALALVANAVVFLAVGALTSQLAATRRQAAAYAAAGLGLAYALRMAADSGAGLSWLRWATPLGWAEQLQPLTGPRPWPLVPLAALVVGVAGLTVYLAGRRDLGASTIPDRPVARPRTALLSGPTGLTVRLVRAVVIGWWVGVALGGLLLGLIAKLAGQALEHTSSFAKVIARLGGVGRGAQAYLGVGFLLVAALVAVMAAGQIAAARAEEAEGRLEHLVVRPVSRRRWLAGRLVVALGALVAAGLVGGLFAWLGTASQGAGLALSTLLGAGVNVVAPAVVVLGVGALFVGLRPRWASAAAYAVVAWSFLVVLIGGVVNANHWLLDTSVFHQMAAAPAVNPDWASVVVMVAVGVTLAVVGIAGFARRDLVGE
jgi:ABC-2 type transport system permease protein